MADNRSSDEQALYSAFQQLADVLLPLKQDLRVRAHAMVGAFLGLVTPEIGIAAVEAETGADQPAGDSSPPPAHSASSKPPSPKDFLAQKKPNTDVERVACLALYLTTFRAMPRFKTIDVTQLNTEAGQRKFANASSTIANATRVGYLAPVAKGMKQLSAQGKRYVDELPDQAAAKAAFGARKPRRQQRQKGAGKAAT